MRKNAKDSQIQNDLAQRTLRLPTSIHMSRVVKGRKNNPVEGMYKGRVGEKAIPTHARPNYFFSDFSLFFDVKGLSKHQRSVSSVL
jgi:hypothetical protein